MVVVPVDNNPANNNKQNTSPEEVALDFALKKFLERSKTVEQKQNMLLLSMEKYWKNVNLQNVYKKIIDQS